MSAAPSSWDQSLIQYNCNNWEVSVCSVSTAVRLLCLVDPENKVLNKLELSHESQAILDLCYTELILKLQSVSKVCLQGALPSVQGTW